MAPSPVTDARQDLAELATRFRALHVPGSPLLMPNAWDAGSARLFVALGCQAIATTSGGFAASAGRLDGAMTRAEVLAHCGHLTGAVNVPVSADLENCFADDPEGVANTITAAIDQGLAGGSVEDFTRDRADPIYERSQAVERVRAAAEAAHGGPVPFVLTARAENYLHGRTDLADTIARLQAYQEAGADVLFAPRVVDPEDLRQLLGAVDRPVSVLVTPDAPTVDRLAELGVSRISVGGAIAAAAYGFAVAAVTELRDHGTTNYWELAGRVRTVMQAAFDPPGARS
jgi:2-methylisocitrate lyase-like PEP mutase family enzyme